MAQVTGNGVHGAAHTPAGMGAQGAHGAGAESHHDVSQDKGAAFVGLIGGVVVIGAFLFGMVTWTNHHLAAEGGEKPAATAHK
jgi:hypothetical protein